MQPTPTLPTDGPYSIEKGKSFKDVLGPSAIRCLAQNIISAFPKFDSKAFIKSATTGLEPLSIMQRGPHIARALHQFLPPTFEKAVDILIASLTPPMDRTQDFGLAVFFYLPHTNFIATHGLAPEHFDTSMRAQYELTQRFTAEFSMRAFLITHQERTLAQLLKWTRDPNEHVRRLCSEGSRPRLPWAQRIPAFIRDPRPTLPILEALKDDPELYVRRSVANHLGDIAKSLPDLAFEICEGWLHKASPERKWLIRHAIRHPAKKGVEEALTLRKRAT